MSLNTSRRYPTRLKREAISIYYKCRPDHDTDWAAMGYVARLLEIAATDTLRKWVRQDEIDRGKRPGVTSEESAQIGHLKRENAQLRRTNSALKAAMASLRPQSWPRG